MNKETSIYLDAVRFTAAMAVFFGHISGLRFTGGLFWQMDPYGSEAVDVFFVLSGFVIAYVHDTRENTPMRYAVSRFARIYSVAIPALVVTFVLDAIGRAARPDLYAVSWGYEWHGRTAQILNALPFFNQIWFNHISPGSDLPYWSLGFEVWYYGLFGIAVFAPLRWRIPAILLVLIVVGPKIIAMAPLWLLGVLAFHICKRAHIATLPASIMCLGAIIGWIGFEIYAWRAGRPISPNWLGFSTIVQDYIIGVLFFVHLIGFRFISRFPGPALLYLARPIRWFAGATLTLYLFHLPLAQFLAAETPWPASSWQTRLMMFAGVPILVFVIAEFTERRKDIWRRGFGVFFLKLSLAIGA